MITKILLGVLIGGAIGGVLGYFGKCSSGACPLTANPYRGAIYGAVMGAILVAAFSHSPRAQKEEMVLHIDSESNFKARVLDVNGISLVDLFSDRCPPCRILAPTISLLANRYAGKVNVCKVDVDRVPTVARRYQVSGIPTVLIIKNGKEVKRLVGLQSESQYVAVLNQLLDQVKD